MDATKWFHIVGSISPGALGIGFVTGLISVALSWKINREQEAKMGQLSLTVEQESVKRLEAEARVGMLEKAATDAKAAQQKVETDLALQQERAALAERSLLELQERIKPRSFTKEQREKFLEVLGSGAKGTFNLIAVADDAEAGAFADEIGNLLILAG